MIPGFRLEGRAGRRLVIPPTIPTDTHVDVWAHRDVGLHEPVNVQLDPDQLDRLADDLRARARVMRSRAETCSCGGCAGGCAGPPGTTGLCSTCLLHCPYALVW